MVFLPSIKRKKSKIRVVTQIERAIRKATERGDEYLVIIGHPKACTEFSLNYLDQLLNRISKKHEIVCLKDMEK